MQENLPGVFVVEKQPFHVPSIIVLLIAVFMGGMLVLQSERLLPLYNDYMALNDLTDHWPQAQAHFTQPLTLISEKPIKNNPMLTAKFVYAYRSPSGETLSSDRYQIGQYAQDGLMLPRYDLRLAAFIANNCHGLAKTETTSQSIYEYKTCRPFTVPYDPKSATYSMLFKAESPIAVQRHLMNQLQTILIPSGAYLVVILCCFFYLTRRKKALPARSTGPSGDEGVPFESEKRF